jgi:hypothetical protein
MKSVILGFIFLVLATGTIFAQEVHRGIAAYLKSIQADVHSISAYPDTEVAGETLEKLRNGNHNFIVEERIIGPSPVSISSAVLDAHRFQGFLSLAASAEAFVSGEVAVLNINKDMKATVVTEITGGIAFAQILRNVREPLRLSYSYLNSDGTPGYLVSLWLAIEKAPLEQEIVDKVAAISSGNYQTGKRVELDEKRTTEIYKPLQQQNDFDMVKYVQSLLSSNERIQRYREQARWLQGFDE